MKIFILTTSDTACTRSGVIIDGAYSSFEKVIERLDPDDFYPFSEPLTEDEVSELKETGSVSHEGLLIEVKIVDLDDEEDEMTPKQLVQSRWPEAWLAQDCRAGGRFQIKRHSDWGVTIIATGDTPQKAWENAAKHERMI